MGQQYSKTTGKDKHRFIQNHSSNPHNRAKLNSLSDTMKNKARSPFSIFGPPPRIPKCVDDQALYTKWHNKSSWPSLSAGSVCGYREPTAEQFNQGHFPK